MSIKWPSKLPKELLQLGALRRESTGAPSHRGSWAMRRLSGCGVLPWSGFRVREFHAASDACSLWISRSVSRGGYEASAKRVTTTRGFGR